VKVFAYKKFSKSRTVFHRLLFPLEEDCLPLEELANKLNTNREAADAS
jgi:hypothetical protein